MNEMYLYKREHYNDVDKLYIFRNNDYMTHATYNSYSKLLIFYIISDDIIYLSYYSTINRYNLYKSTKMKYFENRKRYGFYTKNLDINLIYE